ncbi:MAG: hypothetical protein WC133_02085 [Candidatus Omnitrophota bacterium]
MTDSTSYNEPMIIIIVCVFIPVALFVGVLAGGVLGMLFRKRFCPACNKFFSSFFLFISSFKVFRENLWALGIPTFGPFPLAKADRKLSLCKCPKCNKEIQVVLGNSTKLGWVASLFLFGVGILMMPILSQVPFSELSMEKQVTIAGGLFSFLLGLFGAFVSYVFLPIQKQEEKTVT